MDLSFGFVLFLDCSPFAQPTALSQMILVIMMKRINGSSHAIYNIPSVGLEPTFERSDLAFGSHIDNPFCKVEDVTPQQEGLVQDS